MDVLAQLTAALAGRYAIEREIGAGGMATVYLARDLKHDRQVALKVLHPDLSAALGATRFLAEIKTTANLQHPHILPLHDSGEVDGYLFYVMPYVAGETLRGRITREQLLPIDEAIRLAKETLAALDYAHRHGVIHRDVKPENILLHDGSALVADFGISLAVSAAGGERMTQAGLSLGTPRYMSPEQAMGERQIDGRTDIYAVSAVLYEMLTGDPPFAGTTVQTVISKVLRERPTPPTTARDTIPAHVEAAILRALAKRPADRFATAAQFSDALGRSSRLAQDIGQPPLGARGDATRWRRIAVAATAAAGVMLLATAWAWLRPSPPKPVVRYAIALDSADVLSENIPSTRIAISRDGSKLVYVGGPRSGLLVRARDQLRATALAGTDPASSPFFSPDGQRVGFIRNGSSLEVASLDGSELVTVTDSLVGQTGAAWGPDGFIYAGGVGRRTLVRVEAKRGAIPQWFTTIDAPSGEVQHGLPDPLPNGKGVIFTVVYTGAKATRFAVAVADVATGKHTVLFPGGGARYAESGHLVYATPDGALMAVPFDQKTLKVTGEPETVAQNLRFSAGIYPDIAISATGTLVYAPGATAGKRQLVWVNRSGVFEPVDPTWTAEFETPAISPDGKRVAVVIGALTRQTDVWVKELDRGPSLKLTFDGQIHRLPTWSPDGRFVTYYSVAGAASPGAVQQLWTKRSDGSAPASPVPGTLRAAGSVWSPDGKWLVLRTSQNTANAGSDILAIRPGVDTIPVPIVATPNGELSPTLSPDGRWMAYASSEGGQTNVYVVPFPKPNGTKWVVSTQGGTEPLWSRSGGELFYRDGRGSLVSVEVKTTPAFSLGTSTTLFSASGFWSGPTHREYDVSRDGKRFLMVRDVGSPAAGALVVVDNWFEELRRKHRG